MDMHDLLGNVLAEIGLPSENTSGINCNDSLVVMKVPFAGRFNFPLVHATLYKFDPNYQLAIDPTTVKLVFKRDNLQKVLDVKNSVYAVNKNTRSGLAKGKKSHCQSTMGILLALFFAVLAVLFFKYLPKVILAVDTYNKLN